MKYEFTIEKNENFDYGIFSSENDAFTHAVSCAAVSIASILYEFDVTIKCTPPVISILLESNSPFTLDECSRKIKGAFHQSSDNSYYPEFKKVTCKSI